MSDPIFSKQFGLAVQSDILGQAAIDRQRRQAQAIRRDNRPAWLAVAARRLAGAFGGASLRREGRGAVRANTSAARHSWTQPTKLPDD